MKVQAGAGSPSVKGQENKKGAVKRQAFGGVTRVPHAHMLSKYKVTCMVGERSEQILCVVCATEEISAPWDGCPKGEMLVTRQRRQSQSQGCPPRALGHVELLSPLAISL